MPYRPAIAFILVMLASPPPFAAMPGEKKAQLCSLCHRAGHPTSGAPPLEGLPAKYLEEAINEYKSGKRPDYTMQANVRNLSARDVRQIAAYYASRPPSPVERAHNAAPTAIQDVRVDHRRAHVLVAEELLDGADVVPRFEKMRCE